MLLEKASIKVIAFPEKMASALHLETLIRNFLNLAQGINLLCESNRNGHVQHSDE